MHDSVVEERRVEAQRSTNHHLVGVHSCIQHKKLRMILFHDHFMTIIAS